MEDEHKRQLVKGAVELIAYPFEKDGHLYVIGKIIKVFNKPFVLEDDVKFDELLVSE